MDWRAAATFVITQQPRLGQASHGSSVSQVNPALGTVAATESINYGHEEGIRGIRAERCGKKTGL